MGRGWLIVLAVAACGRFNFDARNDATDDATGSQANYAFVTSSVQLPTSFGADLAGADQICNMRAHDAGLPGTYVAWLSSSTSAARDRLGSARGWIRTDGLPFAATVDDIVSNKIIYPLNHDENGIAVPSDYALTGTGDDGLFKQNCADFSDSGQMIYFGKTEATAHGWTDESTSACTMPGRIYCFGTTYSAQVSVTPATGRTAFLSSQAFVPGAGGLSLADAICNSEATANSLPSAGNYRALLATTSAGAMSRFTLTGPTWVRTDGVPLAASAFEFSNGALEAPLNVTAAKTYRIANAFAGSMSLSAPSTVANCADWTSTVGNGMIGLPAYINSNFFYVSYIMRTCAAGMQVYCLEQ